MTGNYKYAVDPKGRITVPSKLRKDLGIVVFITNDLDGALTVRSKKQFQELEAELLGSGHMSKSARQIQRYILGNTFEVELDKQGRILLPKDLVASTDIKDEVVITAAGNRIEIFSTESWNKFMDEMKNGALEAAAEELNGN